MKCRKKYILMIVVIITVLFVSEITAVENNDLPESSSRLIKVTINSQYLKKEMNVNVYFPPGYSEAKNYPVLYIMHGYTGNENSWMPELGLNEKTDQLIREKKIKPLIIIAPDIDNSYGLNTAIQARMMGYDPVHSMYEGLYEDYICKELIPLMDRKYNTIPRAEGRYIGGMSMGGFVSLHIAFSHPDMFSRVGGHSPALFLKNFSLENWLYPTESIREERDPIYIARDKDLSSLSVYLDCGDSDSYRFYEGCEILYNILNKNGVEVEYHLNKGRHEGLYWAAHLEEYLLFYAGN